MKTMQEEWREYRDFMYPKQLSAIQNIETHQAFFAGALVTFGLMMKITKMPNTEMIPEVEKLHREILSVNKAASARLKSRN